LQAWLRTSLVRDRSYWFSVASYGDGWTWAFADGEPELALSYWPDEASIRAWKQHADHLMAQQLGRERWYSDYQVEVAEIKRQYTAHPAS
jgi:hypothetical protein